MMIPQALRALPAILLMLAAAFLSVHAYALSSLVTLQVLLILHPLYHWTVFRPGLFPVWLAFLLGFALDLWEGRLLGLNAFLFVFAALIIARQRRYLLSQPFATQWAGFLLVALGVEVLRWLVMNAIAFTLFPPASALVSAVCNAALYPLTALVMSGALKLISPAKSPSLLDG